MAFVGAAHPLSRLWKFVRFLGPAGRWATPTNSIFGAISTPHPTLKMPSLSEASGPRTAPKNHFQNFPENLFNSNRAAKQFRKTCNFYHKHVVTCRTGKKMKIQFNKFSVKKCSKHKVSLKLYEIVVSVSTLLFIIYCDIYFWYFSYVTHIKICLW